MNAGFPNQNGRLNSSSEHLELREEGATSNCGMLKMVRARLALLAFTLLANGMDSHSSLICTPEE